jgi:hypothetical protein
VTFAFIAAEKAKDQTMNIAWACRTLGVSTSGFYEWRTAQVNSCQRHREDDQLRATIRDIHRRSRGTYGAPRVHAELRLGLDIRVGRKRVERLMRADGLQGVTRRRRQGLTRRDATAVPNDDLVARQFTPNGPNELWVADITEHPSDDGRVYLAVVIDAWNRQVVGHSIADHLRAELVVDALDMACWRQRPVAGQTVHHSDHGTQGGFRWSSQHLEMEVLRGGVQASSCADDPRDAGEDVVPWPAFDGATRGSGPVLGGDCPRPIYRRRWRRGWRVIRGRGQVVPGVWRDAVAHVGPGVGPLPVLRRARGDRNPACAAARRA